MYGLGIVQPITPDSAQKSLATSAYEHCTDQQNYASKVLAQTVETGLIEWDIMKNVFKRAEKGTPKSRISIVVGVTGFKLTISMCSLIRWFWSCNLVEMLFKVLIL